MHHLPKSSHCGWVRTVMLKTNTPLPTHMLILRPMLCCWLLRVHLMTLLLLVTHLFSQACVWLICQASVLARANWHFLSISSITALLRDWMTSSQCFINTPGAVSFLAAAYSAFTGLEALLDLLLLGYRNTYAKYPQTVLDFSKIKYFLGFPKIWF